MYMYGVILSSSSYNPILKDFKITNYLEFKINLWWTCVLFIMLIGSPNFFNNLFELKILRSIGKFSFGIYLYHPMCIDLIKEIVLIKFSYEYYFYATGLSYCVGFVFFYCIENIMINQANYLCKLLSSIDYFKNKPVLKEPQTDEIELVKADEIQELVIPD